MKSGTRDFIDHTSPGKLVPYKLLLPDAAEIAGLDTYRAEGSSLLSAFSNRRSCTKGGGFLSRFSLPSKNLREQEERLLYTA